MYEFTSDEKLELAYLIHDKSHVGARGQPIRALETAFDLFSTRCQVKLFRGINPYDNKLIADNEQFSLPGYVSFTERFSYARKIAAGNKTNRVLVLDNGVGFSYWRWFLSDLLETKAEYPDEFDAIDGKLMVKTLREEKEWIFPRNTTFQIVSKKSTEGLELITVQQAS